MPVAKITFFMRSSATGWTDNYRRTVANIAALVTPPQGANVNGAINGVPQVNTPLGQLMQARIALASDEITFTRIRVSIEGSPRNVQIFRWAGTGFATGQYKAARAFGVATPAVEDWTALLLQVGAGQASQGRLFLHGCPEQILDPPETYVPGNTGFQNLLTTFANVLIGGEYLVEGRARIPSPPQPLPVPIQIFTPDQYGITAQVTPIPLSPTGVQPTGGVPFYVVVRGRKFSEWNGVHRAVWPLPVGAAPAPTYIVIGPGRRPYREVASVTAMVPGTIQALALLDSPITTVLPESFVEHRVGRPFGAPVGRRTRR